MSLIATVPTSVVAYLVRSGTPIIARFDVGTVLLNTELIPERKRIASSAQLPTRLSLFKADNYIEIILQRLTCITAIQMDSERSNLRVSSKRYVISKYSSMSALLSRWYRCTGKRKKRYKSLPRTRTLQRPEKSERKADKPCWF